ncbi:ATP-binding protein [Microaerobacter geothermalis]|uniref:AlbA family DNA-binding domain-containing protein n=1 Tax=Microaerobacter geothermalis TaxID=674972 RepID=UPI001F265893|nr:ATP-binding protein [Microaerobacter geothermalis]MCF6094038.1 ATP-binding protein [Microaerobacter geothermalis]
MIDHFVPFLVYLHDYDEQECHFDLFHRMEPIKKWRKPLEKLNAHMPRRFFDFLYNRNVLYIVNQGEVQYEPIFKRKVGVGFSIKYLGETISFDLYFAKKSYRLWQHVVYIMEDLWLEESIFQEMVYRLEGLTQFRYLGKVSNPKEAVLIGENQYIEFKRDFLFSKGKLIRTVVAFANTNNGNLFLGIDDDGKIIGIDDDIAKYQNEDKFLLAVTHFLQEKITPLLSPFPTLRIVPVENKRVLHIYVEEGSDLYCALEHDGKKNVVIRTNNQSIRIEDPQKIGELYVKRKLGKEIGHRLGLL